MRKSRASHLKVLRLAKTKISGCLAMKGI